MTSFLSDDEKIHLAAQFKHLHDTFARDIVVYKEAQKVVINTDPNYNYIYNNSGPTTSIENVPQKKVFKARVFYDYNREMEYFGETNAQTKVERISANDRVRIKLEKADYNYIKGAKRIEFDERMFFIDSDARAHGLFDVDFYTLFLKPVE